MNKNAKIELTIKLGKDFFKSNGEGIFIVSFVKFFNRNTFRPRLIGNFFENYLNQNFWTDNFEVRIEEYVNLKIKELYKLLGTNFTSRDKF